MSVSDIREERWNRAQHPQGLDPLDAVHACLREIPPGEARHIIVCVARKNDEDGEAHHRYFQAGDYNAHGQIGLLEACKDMMRE